MAFLQAEGIVKRFGATLALDGVNLSVEAGEVHALVGENGSGKSTLMRILAGVLKPDGGRIRLGGQDYAPKTPSEARRAGVAMIHQELAVCPDLSVAENVLLGMEDTRAGVIRLPEARRRTREALSQLGHAGLDPDTPLGNLPLALRQLVEIARAVAVGSRLVILDEPTSSLTRADVENLFAVVCRLRESGKAVLYISHFLDEIHTLADRMTVLRDGKSIAELPEEGTTDEEIVRLMVGRPIEDMYPRSERTPGEVILAVDEVQGREKPVSATFNLHRGEVFGVAGLNGSGRTELLRVIFGLDEIRKGSVRLNAFTGAASPALRWKQGLGLLSEDRKDEGLFLNLAIAENVAMASLNSALVSPVRQDQTAAGWIERLRVRCQGPEQAVGELSGGNQQKVAIARMLERDVDVFLFDEPTRGIDVGSKEQIYRLIDELALRGKAVILVSSYLPELLGVCDRIAVMSRGVLSEAVPARSATQESLMRSAVEA